MSLRSTAAHSSRIKKSSSRPPSLKRALSSPFSTHPRRKPIQRASSSLTKPPLHDDDDASDRLEDIGIAQSLLTDLTLRDVAQAIKYIRAHMFEPLPERRAGMGSERISEVLRFREGLPPLVGVGHVLALLSRLGGTRVEREIVELVRGGVVRKVVVGGRGGLGEGLVLVGDLEDMILRSGLEERVREKFLDVLRKDPMALGIERGVFTEEEAGVLMRAGFLTAATTNWTAVDVFSRPGEGSRGTMTSLQSVSRAASGSMAAVGGEGALHNAGGSGGGARSSQGAGDLALALPATGAFLKLVTGAKAHLLALLGKSRYREAPESLLRERWDGGISDEAPQSEARRNRGEFVGVLPGRTRKWKQFYGLSFEWVLGECVGAGLVEVFETGSIGRAVRAL